jgi:hypothetical protein
MGTTSTDNRHRGGVLRRREDAPVVEAAPEPGPESGPAPVAEPSEAVRPDTGATVSELAQASPRTHVLEVGTSVRMIGGVHMGRVGVVTTVQNRATSTVIDALYTLVLDEADGEAARVFVKQSSLGRLWVRAAAAA